MKRRVFLGTVAASSAAAVLNAENASARELVKAKPTKITLLAPARRRHRSTGKARATSSRWVTTSSSWHHGPGAHHRLLETGHRAVDVNWRVLHAPALRPLYGLRSPGPPTVGPRRGTRFGSPGVGPPPIKRMTDLLFGEDGVYGPDIRARIEHPSSIDQFVARGGKRRGNGPRRSVREIHAGRRHRKETDGKSRLAPRNARRAVPRVPRVSPRRARWLALLHWRQRARATRSSRSRRAATSSST